MLDGTPAAGPQPAARQFDDRVDDSHPVRATEQCMRWIMLCHFGFQCHPVGDVGRVGDQEVDLAVQFGQQRGVGDVGVQEFDRGAQRCFGGRKSSASSESSTATMRASGQNFDRASASAAEPVHRSTITGRGGSGWADAHSSSPSVSGRGMNTPGPTWTVTGPSGAVPTMCCNGIRCERAATRSA